MMTTKYLDDETLDKFMVSTEMDSDKNDNDDLLLFEEDNNGDIVQYEADNEDLDNLPNKEMVIDPINDKQKKCVDQFLMKYSENNSWDKTCDGLDGYKVEIEFHENVNLENKKNNNISISSNILQSLTNLIENIMGIQSQDNYKQNSYFSLCGWFCGKSSMNEFEDYSSHYLDILSSLDYNKKNREEIYWVIYQLLNIIYKFYNQTQRAQKIEGDHNGNKWKMDREEEGNGNDNKLNENVSDSESMSMVMTQSKSKYAELKPPQRRKILKKNTLSKNRRGSFCALSNESSTDEEQ